MTGLGNFGDPLLFELGRYPARKNGRCQLKLAALVVGTQCQDKRPSGMINRPNPQEG